MPRGVPDPRFCCTGCREVHALLAEQGLTRYYELAGGEGAPVAERVADHSLSWLEPLLARQATGDGICSLELDVQGVHCAACVWLMGELFRRRPGSAGITVNPALGKVHLAYRRPAFDVRAYVSEVERFGYAFGPSRKKADAASRDLPIRIGICAAIAINVMMFSASFYVGLAPGDGALFTLFTQLTVWLSAISVAVGGWVFFRGAWLGLRRRVLHLDLPIAAGILLAFGTSLAQARGGRGDLAYFDTLDVFVTLMLVGRWLQQRVLERNRRFLLEDDGADGIWVRRREGDALELVRAPQVREGDDLLVAPGDLVPVDAELLDGTASFSTDWITGESALRELARGDTVIAGSFLAGARAVSVRAKGSFERSPLPALLRPAPGGGATRHARFWDRLARVYVLAVLALAAVGFAIWWPVDPGKALEVTVALLVVTCPCAIGIAIPLGNELVLSRLRRAGVFVRGADLLDRLTRVRKVVFDKTGTLTLGRLGLVDPGAVERLGPALKDAAYDMAARSNHPVSRCLAGALARAGARFDAAAPVVEVPGEGLLLERGGRTYRLGSARFAAPGESSPLAQGTVLSVDGVPAARFEVEDRVRSDARREIAGLHADGQQVWLLSGDDPARAASTAAALGIPAERAFGGQRPEQKAARVAELDRGDTLYLGDGINDSLAFERALCAGTPAIGRPVLPAKADFFLLGEGIAGVREALLGARRLQATVRRNVALALAYNAAAVALCLAGAMTPLRAAIAMPASSIVILLWTTRALARDRAADPVQPVEEVAAWTR